MMNKFPYNNGHLLVYPWKHTGLLEDMDSEESLEIFGLMKKSAAILKKEMNAGGFNIGMNIGKSSGAGFADHVHIHIVPRWNSDTNFMPVLSETKVMPEHLNSTYDKLLSLFKNIEL